MKGLAAQLEVKGMPEQGSVEIISQDATQPGVYEPQTLIPGDAQVPKSHRAQWIKLAARARSSPGWRAPVTLKCLDCCGWERAEAKRCVITTCALWALNQRIFGGA